MYMLLTPTINHAVKESGLAPPAFGLKRCNQTDFVPITMVPENQSLFAVVSIPVPIRQLCTIRVLNQVIRGGSFSVCITLRSLPVHQ